MLIQNLGFKYSYRNFDNYVKIGQSRNSFITIFFFKEPRTLLRLSTIVFMDIDLDRLTGAFHFNICTRLKYIII